MLTPIILCGGVGSRLWPLSRESFPKQLLTLQDDQSLLVGTLDRLAQLKDLSDPILVCNLNHRFLVAQQLLDAGINNATLILEPIGRNTAPAALVAALVANEIDPDSQLLILPADHLITDTDEFCRVVTQGTELVTAGHLVTFGVVPAHPETGYGYIQRGNSLTSTSGFAIQQFVEKPDLPTAESYLANGDYLWNSGMFLFSASQLLSEMEQHAPSMVDSCRQAVVSAVRDSQFIALDEQHFSGCEADSIDYALMEKTAHGAVIPLDAGWSDIGSWAALWDVDTHDPEGNACVGDVLLEQVQGSYFHSTGRLLAGVGVSDLVVVETEDAVLVANKTHSQNVKLMVDQLKQLERPEVDTHAEVFRPWGSYRSIDQGPGFQVKRITVNPGQLLSLQLHHHRAEHWTVVQGSAEVTCGDQRVTLTADQSIYIPVETKHRLENTGDDILILIEVQCGSYLGEDDIVRFEDKYGR
ncbi:MAG: mannose-1-phosphate guanylyltransferase/mannose-6-phosphate isomerase [Immundisolibacteraceae bacterium]|nr:mannose-1-phosphate guanylyltransferase/mannose-6-phosphate isomerase [Immundisolibacteraceae bacterium]